MEPLCHFQTELFFPQRSRVPLNKQLANKGEEGDEIFFYHLLLYLRNKSIEAPLPLLWVQLGMIEQGLHDGKVVSHLVSQAWQRDNCTVQFKLPEPHAFSAPVSEPPADVH